MTDSQEHNATVEKTTEKQVWQTPVLNSLDTENTAGIFAGGDEGDSGMTS